MIWRRVAGWRQFGQRGSCAMAALMQDRQKAWLQGRRAAKSYMLKQMVHLNLTPMAWTHSEMSRITSERGRGGEAGAAAAAAAAAVGDDDDDEEEE